MKTYLRALSTGLFLVAFGAVAFADTVVVSPEQQTVIREYVKKNPVASIDLPGISLDIGSTLPDTVELHQLDVPDAKYEYVVVGGRTVLVDPGTHKVIYTLD
jgi:hypothetical protein